MAGTSVIPGRGQEVNGNVESSANECSPLLNSIPSGSTLTISSSTADDESASSRKQGRHQHSSSTAADPPPGGIPAHVRRRIAFSLYFFCFLVMLGEYSQPAARTQVYEDAICHRYYAGLRPLDLGTLPPGGGSDFPPDNSLNPPGDGGGSLRCKIQPVQNELSLLRGYEQLTQVIPTLICAVPFGRLADRFGRRRMILFNVIGIVISDLWSLSVVGPWVDILSVRAVWASGAILLFFGGSSLTSSLIHVMVTDFAEETERTRIFVFMNAGAMIAGFLGPIISGALMEHGRSWTVLLLSEVIKASAGLFLLLTAPETQNIRERFASLSPDDYVSGAGASLPPRAVDDSSGEHGLASAGSTFSTHGKKPKTFLDGVHAAIEPVTSIFTSNRQVPLLLIMFTPLLAARETFTFVGLLYTDEKFQVPFSRGNVLLFVYQATQAFLYLVIIPIAVPYVVRRISSPPSSQSIPNSSSAAAKAQSVAVSAWNQDLNSTIISISLAVIGLIVVGLAPTIPVVISGLVITALGQGSSSMVLSLLGASVRPDQVSTLYGIALMVNISCAGVLAPVASLLLNEGLARGKAWLGLPFWVMAGIMAVALAASVMLKKEGMGEQRSTDSTNGMEDDAERRRLTGGGEDEEELIW